MRKLLVGAALAGLVAAPAGAQNAGDPITSGHGSFYVGPYVGYLNYGQLWDFGASELTSDDGVAFGAQAGWSFSPNFAILGNFAYNKSNFQIEYDQGGSTQVSGGDLGFFFYDGSLQFRLPVGQSSGWIAPFAQIGAGAIKYTVDTDDFNSDGNTTFAFNAGIGADLQFRERLGVRLMLKDYITSLAWDDVESVTFDDEVDGNTAHNLLLSIGLNFGF